MIIVRAERNVLAAQGRIRSANYAYDVSSWRSRTSLIRNVAVNHAANRPRLERSEGCTAEECGSKRVGHIEKRGHWIGRRSARRPNALIGDECGASLRGDFVGRRNYYGCRLDVPVRSTASTDRPARRRCQHNDLSLSGVAADERCRIAPDAAVNRGGSIE